MSFEVNSEDSWSRENPTNYFLWHVSGNVGVFKVNKNFLIINSELNFKSELSKDEYLSLISCVEKLRSKGFKEDVFMFEDTEVSENIKIAYLKDKVLISFYNEENSKNREIFYGTKSEILGMENGSEYFWKVEIEGQTEALKKNPLDSFENI